MKTLYLNLAIIFTTIVLSSCGGGNGSISDVKLIPVKNGKEFQYIDKEGKTMINPQFKEATIFRNGLALVQTSGDNPVWGYITEDGKYAINAQYKEATVFNDGIAWAVMENSAPTAIDKTGKVLFILQNAEKVYGFNEGLAAFSTLNENGDKTWGFVDKEGKVVINQQFDAVSNFSDGKCGVMNSNSKWGFIDKSGKIIINYQFDGISDFKNGKCVVELSNKKGLIDNEGKYLINPQYTDMVIDGNMYLIEQDGKMGWCDEDGKILINPQFSGAYPFNGNKITSVKSGGNFGYIDINGKMMINPQFDGALPFNGKLALVVSSGKIGFIDRDGKYAINPQYDGVSVDLVEYFLDGNSGYNSIKTDFFNVGAIASLPNFTNPEGFTFNSTFEDILTKYSLDEGDFNKYTTTHEVLSEKKITQDAKYSFYAIGSPFDKKTVKNGSGWYSYTDTEYIFNGMNKPVSYAYIISLTGKGTGKEESVISAIKEKLNGYKKDEKKSTLEVSVFNDDQTLISLFEKDKNIIIVITQKKDSEVAIE